MDHYEMVEKLREKANVSYDEAKRALEASDWDLLDAIVFLENEGKINSGGKDYSTQKSAPEPEPPKKSQFADNMSYLGRQAAGLLEKLNGCFVDVFKNGNKLFSLPVLVLVILLIFMWYLVVPLLIVGLFFGFRYSFRGAQFTQSVNKVMEKASEMADDIRKEVVGGANKDGDEQ